MGNRINTQCFRDNRNRADSDDGPPTTVYTEESISKILEERDSELLRERATAEVTMSHSQNINGRAFAPY